MATEDEVLEEVGRIVVITMHDVSTSLSFTDLRCLCEHTRLQEVLDDLVQKSFIKSSKVGHRKELYELTKRGVVAAKRIIRRWPKHLREL
jgi:predicted transcriptional regulator